MNDNNDEDRKKTDAKNSLKLFLVLISILIVEVIVIGSILYSIKDYLPWSTAGQ